MWVRGGGAWCVVEGVTAAVVHGQGVMVVVHGRGGDGGNSWRHHHWWWWWHMGEG